MYKIPANPIRFDRLNRPNTTAMSQPKNVRILEENRLLTKLWTPP